METKKTLKEEAEKYLKTTNEFISFASNELGEEIKKTGQKYLKELNNHLIKHGFDTLFKKEK